MAWTARWVGQARRRCLGPVLEQSDRALPDRRVAGASIGRVAAAGSRLEASAIEHGDVSPVIADQAVPLQIAGTTASRSDS